MTESKNMRRSLESFTILLAHHTCLTFGALRPFRWCLLTYFLLFTTTYFFLLFLLHHFFLLPLFSTTSYFYFLQISYSFIFSPSLFLFFLPLPAVWLHCSVCYSALQVLSSLRLPPPPFLFLISDEAVHLGRQNPGGDAASRDNRSERKGEHAASRRRGARGGFILVNCWVMVFASPPAARPNGANIIP